MYIDDGAICLSAPHASLLVQIQESLKLISAAFRAAGLKLDLNSIKGTHLMQHAGPNGLRLHSLCQIITWNDNGTPRRLHLGGRDGYVEWLGVRASRHFHFTPHTKYRISVSTLAWRSLKWLTSRSTGFRVILMRRLYLGVLLLVLFWGGTDIVGAAVSLPPAPTVRP